MAHDKLVGQQLSSYRLISQLGDGAFSEVYLGEHIHLATKAAIKVLQNQLVDDNFKSFFLIEARTMASLQHPNIVRILDFGVKGQILFLITEYAPKGSLAALYQNIIGTPQTILPYVKQVAAALQYAHQQGFIHGQVMPRNMLLRQNNEVILDHFDFSRLPDNKREPGLRGTPIYLAPEQMHGQLLPASDQYALGVTVYQWLTGRKLFDGDSSLTILLKHMHEQPPPLRAPIPTISADVEQVVLKALAKNPQQRFPNVQDFANAFEQACQHKYYTYDVALSFAGEDRNYANDLAEALRYRRLNVFYDNYEKTTLWGKNLYTYLSEIYQDKARYCVMFLSKNYAAKLWTNHEREAAQARAFSENEEYILPVRLDNTKIPGIPPTIAYLSWPPENAGTLADIIVAKLASP